MAKKGIICNHIEYGISYEILNMDQEKTILFLHGWGASKRIMKQAFGEHFSNFKLIFIDLPGFGSSSIEVPLNSFDYRDIVNEFLSSLHVEPHMIFGHSFGGKIATLLKPKRMVLLSSAGIVPKKSFKVRVKIKLYKLFKSFGFGGVYKLFASQDVKGMDEVMYDTFKKVVDERFDDEFSSFGGEAMIFWGKADKDTPISSGEKIHELIKKSKFYPLLGHHFFFFDKGKDIEKILKENSWC